MLDLPPEEPELYSLKPELVFDPLNPELSPNPNDEPKPESPDPNPEFELEEVVDDDVVVVEVLEAVFDVELSPNPPKPPKPPNPASPKLPKPAEPELKPPSPPAEPVLVAVVIVVVVVVVVMAVVLPASMEASAAETVSPGGKFCSV